MLQVCGRTAKLAILHLFISSRSDSAYTHSLLHLNYCVLNAGKSSKYTLRLESTESHQEHKELSSHSAA